MKTAGHTHCQQPHTVTSTRWDTHIHSSDGGCLRLWLRDKGSGPTRPAHLGPWASTPRRQGPWGRLAFSSCFPAPHLSLTEERLLALLPDPPGLAHQPPAGSPTNP